LRQILIFNSTEFVDEKLAAHNEEDRYVLRLTFLKGKKRKREERLLVIGTYRLYVFKGTKVIINIILQIYMWPYYN
jgi:hypothetical protein